MKQRTPALCLSLFILLTLLWMQGCVRPGAPQGNAAPPVVHVLQSQTPTLADAPDMAPLVYVSLRDSTDKVFGLRALLENTLTRRGYSITENPSQAGYILQLHIIHAGGMSPAAVRQAVPQGYGQDVDASGSGACVLMADLIVAARTVPRGGPRRSHVIASVSSRSTVADEQWRVAAFVEEAHVPFSKVHTALEKSMVEAVTAIFPARPQ